MRKIKKINELFFDHSEIKGENVRFYLTNPENNKGFIFDVKQEDEEELSKILDRNNVAYEIDDGTNELPF